jgi:hypothetical protein
MHYEIEREIARFGDIFQNLAAMRRGDLALERVCEHGYLVKPTRVAVAPPPGKRIALTLLGLTHGNEWAGAAVLANLGALIAAGLVTPTAPTAFLLGNTAAARENQRFLDRDMNRSFGRPTPALREERRAAELAGVLRETAYFVDYHQVSRPSDRAFFIFTFSRASFHLARAIAPRQTIVTHWGKPFSVEGMCSDEYVNAQGGVGVSIELGQNGFDPYQIAVGVDTGLWAMRAVTRALEEGLTAAAIDPYQRCAPGEEGELFTWAEILPWPEGSYVELAPGLTNFQEIPPGAAIGTVDGRPLLATTGGRVLFPKYMAREAQAVMETRPTELLRLMRPLAEGELPE